MKKWYNISGQTEEVLEVFLKEIIKKGNVIEFNFDSLGNEVSELARIGEARIENKSDKVVNIKGKDFVTYSGLLEKAHEKGLRSIEILESWVSEDMKRAWCKVRAKFLTEDENTMFFDGFGSSTPENTGEMTQGHPVEMAHTRAKGRALRDFLNIGTAMLEELKNN